MDYLANQPGGLTDEAFKENMFESKRERNWFQVNWLLYSFHAYYDFNEKTHFSIISHMLDANRYAVGFRSNRVWMPDLNIERDLGRKRNKKNAPRICDIDIIDYDQKIINNLNGDNLQIPHSKMHTRNFVLLPLFEINKDWIHPVTKKHIKKLILSLSNRDIRSIKQI